MPANGTGRAPVRDAHILQRVRTVFEEAAQYRFSASTGTIAWRYTVVIANLTILVTTGIVWHHNFRDKWRGLDRRWSHGNMQYVTPFLTRTPYYDNRLNNMLGSEMRPGSVLFPRIYQANAQCRQNPCDSDEIWRTSDYASLPEDMSFLANVDVPILTMLCMWVSTSYAIFSLPNEAQALSSRALEDATYRCWNFRCNWIMAFLFVWNFGGIVALYAMSAGVDIPFSTVFTGSAVLLWTTGVQMLWIIIGRSTRTIMFSGASGTANATPSSSVHEVQYWVHFIKINDIAFVFPTLLVCVMAVVRDTPIVSEMQYVFGYSTTALTLLVAQDVLGVMAQEQITYNVLQQGKRSDHSVAVWTAAAMQQCVDNIMDMIFLVMPRISIASVGMQTWALCIYYNSIAWWTLDGNADFFMPQIVLLAKLLPVYGILSMVLNLVRSYLRLYYHNMDQAQYIRVQGWFNTGLTVFWDTLSIVSKGTACLVLAYHAHDVPF